MCLTKTLPTIVVAAAFLLGSSIRAASQAKTEAAAELNPYDAKTISPEMARRAPAQIYTRGNPPLIPKPEELPLKKSLSQYGMTWIFDQPTRAGQFVNGDWYVVGPVTI